MKIVDKQNESSVIGISTLRRIGIMHYREEQIEMKLRREKRRLGVTEEKVERIAIKKAPDLSRKM